MVKNAHLQNNDEGDSVQLGSICGLSKSGHPGMMDKWQTGDFEKNG